jgi:hypothetical protein
MNQEMVALDPSVKWRLAINKFDVESEDVAVVLDAALQISNDKNCRGSFDRGF